jgi:CspA family cold shock protein
MREIGIVKWYDSREGSGYIARKKGGDVYVHHSAVCSASGTCTLKEGVAVEFTVVEESDGARAHDVVILR